MKTLAFTTCAVIMSAGTALAAQNVANTTQKGSLLIWPLINVDPKEGADTYIEISNDSSARVHVECYYVNEKKGRVDFDFHLTGKQTASWSVGTLAGDQVQPAVFPTSGTFHGGGNYPPTNPYRGELACFAVNNEGTSQIAFNHLSGTATVVNYQNYTTDNESHHSNQAFKYNPWSFVARNAQGLPEKNNTLQGEPGKLLLTGAGAGTYDACPVYNIAKFMPNGGGLGNLRTRNNALTVVSCKQDLRQDYELNLTKLKFTAWNSYESSFTGAYICVDSVNTVDLSARNGYLVNGTNFEYSTLRTPNARYMVQGVQSTQCVGSTSSALLGVVSSEINLGEGHGDQEVGGTTHGAGSAPGYVYWDVSDPVPFRR